MRRLLAAACSLAVLGVAGCSGGNAAHRAVATSSQGRVQGSQALLVDPTAGTGLDVQPFPVSFWTTPLPSVVPLDPRSAVLAADLARQVADSRKRYGYHPVLNTSTYAPPVFRAGVGAPGVVVTGKACQASQNAGGMATWQRALGTVPIPAGAKPSAGTDREMVVWQQSTDTIWELWKAAQAPDGSWTACWGGKLAHASTSSGVFPAPYGTAASGLSLVGGLLTPSEVASGIVTHALSVGLPLTAKHSVAPARRTDGRGPDATTLAEGARFRLPLDYPVTGTAVQQTLIRALKTYGAVVRDTSGAMSFYGENTYAETGVSTWGPVLTQPSYTLFDGIDWSKVQVVDPSVDVVLPTLPSPSLSAPPLPTAPAAPAAVVRHRGLHLIA